MKGLVLAALAVMPPFLAEADPIRWSEPRQVASDSAVSTYQYGHSMDARDTSFWIVWLEDRDTSRGLVKASRSINGAWGQPESLGRVSSDPYFVELAVDASLCPWATWSFERRAGGDTHYSYCLWSPRQGGSWSEPRLITTDTLGLIGIAPAITSDPERGAWAIWMRLEPAQDSMSIYSSFNRADSWATPCLVARFLWWFVPYIPTITAPPNGRVKSVWTGAPSGGVGVYSAVWGGDSWEEREPIPSSGLGYYPSVCSDSQGGTWVTWYDGFSGSSPSIRCARHDGVAWTDTWSLATGWVSVIRGSLCCDEQGRVWALWTQERPGTTDTSDICVRRFDGDSWSTPSVVTTCVPLLHPRIAAALGRVWVTWSQWEPDDRLLLYYSHTLASGVAEERERRPAAVAPLRVLPSPARDRVWLEGTDRATLFTPDGRRAATLTHGTNDVRHLSRGVYFVRSPERRESARIVLVE